MLKQQIDAGARVADDGKLRSKAGKKASSSGARDVAMRREGFARAHAAEPNRLLAALPLDDYSYILPQLRPQRLSIKQVLIEPDVPIEDVFFIRDGVGSVIANAEDGAVEVGLVGKEGLVGLPLLFGVASIPNRVIVQVEGDAWRLGAGAFRQLIDERPAVRHAWLPYAQFFLTQVSQSVACNRLHTLEERCARWLLMTLDRLDGDTFEITHEFLALMLGVRRAGVSVVMGALQSQGILSYGRGRVVVLDRGRLEEASCSCYGVTRMQPGSTVS